MPGLRADQIALYTKDMYKAEREGFKEADPRYPDVYKVVNNVKGAGDKITQILGAGALARHTVEGQDIVFKAPVQGWEYLVKYWTFSDGITLTKEAVEDTVKLGNLLKELSKTWGKSVRVEKETFGSRPFNEGGNLTGDWILNGTHSGNTDSSGDLLYDGYPLFNVSGNDRSTKGGGTYYNSIASLEVDPDDFETVYNLHTSTNNRDERDRVVKNPADTLMVPPGSMRFKADRIVDTSRGLPGGQLNDTNPYYKIVSVIDWDYLTDYTAGSSEVFYVGKKKADGCQFHERQAPEIRFFRDETNLGYKASINIRIGVLFKDFRCWSRGGGTSA
jgi:hypothetical protein